MRGWDSALNPDRTVIVPGMRLGTGRRKHQRGDQQGRCEDKPEKVPQVSHDFQAYHKPRANSGRSLKIRVPTLKRSRGKTKAKVSRG